MFYFYNFDTTEYCKTIVFHCKNPLQRFCNKITEEYGYNCWLLQIKIYNVCWQLWCFHNALFLPEHWLGTIGLINNGNKATLTCFASARVMFIKIMLECIPTPANSDHHMIAKDLENKTKLVQFVHVPLKAKPCTST